MGECGCGNFSGDITFPAPGGDVYVLDVYPSCEDCGTPAGIVLYRFTRKEAEHWGVLAGRVPLEIGEEGTVVPVLEPDILCRLLVKEAKAEAWGECDPAEVIRYGIHYHFRDAAYETFSRWLKKRRAAPPGERGEETKR